MRRSLLGAAAANVHDELKPQAIDGSVPQERHAGAAQRFEAAQLKTISRIIRFFPLLPATLHITQNVVDFLAMKVALYARYSSERQRDSSIADQFRNCERFPKTLRGSVNVHSLN